MTAVEIADELRPPPEQRAELVELIMDFFEVLERKGVLADISQPN